jgi:hypothetical protein
MNAANDQSPHARIEAKLADILEAAPTTPGWHEQWKRLGLESTAEQRLAVYQAIRDSDSLPHEASFYLVSWQIDEIAAQDAASALRPLEDRLNTIERKHGLGDGESWSRGEAPAEYEEVRLEYQRAWDELFADRLDKYGEREMAELLRTDHVEFERRTEAGRQFFFHGPRLAGESSLSGWLDSLFEIVAANMIPQNAMGPLGLRYCEDDGMWEVSVYPTPVELVGGAVDGEVVAPDFTLDLEGLRSAFERVDESGWRALGLPGTEGPHVWIEGLYMGHEVYLQVLAYAPDDEEPGMKLDVSRSGNH